MTNLKAIRERVEKATSGEWKMWDGYGPRGGFHYTPRIGTNIATVFSAGGKDIEGRKEDFEFVARARQDIPELLDAFEEALGLLKQVLPTKRAPLDTYFSDSYRAIEAFLAKHGEGKRGVLTTQKVE